MKGNLGKISTMIAIVSLVALAIQNGLNIEPARSIYEQNPESFVEMGMVEKAVNTGGLRISIIALFIALIGLVIGIIGLHSSHPKSKNALLYNLFLMISSFTPYYVWFL